MSPNLGRRGPDVAISTMMRLPRPLRGLAMTLRAEACPHDTLREARSVRGPRLHPQRRAALAAEAVTGRRLRATVVAEDGRGIDPAFINGLGPGPSMTRPRRTVLGTGPQEVDHAGGDQTHAGDQQDPG